MQRVVAMCVTVASTAALGQNPTNPPFNPAGSTRVTLANGFAAIAGTGGNDAVLNQSARTLEWVFSGSQISMLAPGARVVGAAFRNAGGTSGPGDFVDFSDWSLSLARSIAAPGSLNSDILLNVGSGSTLVRSGPLQVVPGTVQGQPGPGKPAPFAFGVNFQNAFEMPGGNLHFLLSNAGSDNPGLALDGAGPGDPGTNVLFQAREADGADSPTTTRAANTPITRLSVDAAVSLPLLTANTSNGEVPFAGALGPSGFSGQFVIGAEQLRHVPRGSLITWLAFRLAPGEAAWPLVDTTTGDFEIVVATGTTRPQTMGLFFDDNGDSDGILVRDGTLTVPAGGFAPASDGRFAMPIHFQRGFVYKGGDLCVTVRHAAFIGSSAGPMLDTANASDAVRTVVAASKTAFSGTFLPADDAVALQVGYTPSVCVPLAYETVSGGSGAWLFETPRVHQMIIDPSQLTHIPAGSTIDGIAFRISPVSLPAFVSWPDGDATVNQFDVYLSTAQRIAAQMSNVFAQNEGADIVRVREGGIVVPSRAMKVVGSDVAEHSFVIPFTRPFVYDGGGLCITMRVGQRVGGGAPVNFDGVFSNSITRGKRATSGSDATDGNTALSFAARLVFTRPVPTCPADLNADGAVDDADFVIFVEAYNFLATPAGDFNFDGVTEDGDFQVFVAGYDALVCP